MQTIILTLHIIVCVMLVILVLLQAGKEGMGVIFGGGNTSVFGSSGAGSVLTKLTAFMAVIFVFTSLSYTYVTSVKPSNESTILDVKIEDVQPKTTGATPSMQTTPAQSAVSEPAAKDAPAQNATQPAAQDTAKGAAPKDTAPPK